MNVLSLFDGISCGMLALLRAGIPVTSYYASEIDKHCIKVATRHFPGIIQLGDIKNWRTWNIGKPDLIIGGPPCQGLSDGGRRGGLQDERSALFWDFADILDFYKPQYFLMENVDMRASWLDIISGRLGVKPAKINSSLFSAQHRQRQYWTNIPIPDLPSGNSLVLKDIVKPGAHSTRSRPIGRWRIISDRYIQFYPTGKNHGSLWARISFLDSKSQTVRASEHAYYVCDRAKFLRHPEDLSNIQILNINEVELLQTLPEGYTEGIPKMYRFRAIGNGWTVDVASHIFRGMGV